MNSKLLMVTVALNQLLIENLDTLEAEGICQQKLKQVSKHFLELLLLQLKRLFKNLPADDQVVFFKKTKTLEMIIRDYQNDTLYVVEESELNTQTDAALI